MANQAVLADAGPSTTTPNPAGVSEPTTQPIAPDAGGVAAAPPSSVEGWRNPEEIKRYFQRTQRIEDGLKSIQDTLRSLAGGKPVGGTAQAAAPATGTDDPGAQALAMVQTMRREQDAERAFAELGIADATHRSVLLKVVHAEKPENVRQYLEALAPAFAKSAPPAAPGTPPNVDPAAVQAASAATLPNPPPAPIRTDLGAPGRGPATTPQDVKLIPPDEWRRMTRDQRADLQAKALGAEQKSSPWARPLPGAAK